MRREVSQWQGTVVSVISAHPLMSIPFLIVIASCKYFLKNWRFLKIETQKQKNQVEQNSKPNRIWTTDAFLQGARQLSLNGKLSYSWCFFVQIQPISQKFNSCVMNRPTNWQTNEQTPFYRDAKTHLKMFIFYFKSLFLISKVPGAFMTQNTVLTMSFVATKMMMICECMPMYFRKLIFLFYIIGPKN